MPAQYSHADAIREYLSGAASDGGTQTSPSLSLGNFRSATEAVSMGVVITNAITGATITYAGGANPSGTGVLTALDANTLTWKPNGAVSAGSPTNFSNLGETKIVEALNQPGQYLRIAGLPPFSGGPASIILAPLYNNFFGMDNVVYADAATGISQYRATIIRNESAGVVGSFKRWLGELGSPQNLAVGGFVGSGAATITTSGSFVSWPETGWCQIQDAGGAIKEVVYYAARSNTMLIIPATGRTMLGTSLGTGALGDTLHAVPGLAIAKEPGGPQAFGSAIQTIANQTTAPTGLTWNLGLDAAHGLSYGDLALNTQVGFWVWRHIPAGIIATPSVSNVFVDSFNSF